MFGLFLNDSLYNFWSNVPGDIFIVKTCSNLGLSPSEVDLLYYPGVNQVPEYYQFNESKALEILERVVTIVPPEVEGGESTELITYEVSSTVTGVNYFNKGAEVEPC